ncbi:MULTISPECIES: hypothetical protein [unclassified Amycolatopsis]|uniref:hypothetical protein n=1 Tax=unclassified Amycolatopsis TaxID=2618356 RepID=UPI0002627174|nr:hypothetical protein [Amycolatopsis sp. ATCC 39116]
MAIPDEGEGTPLAKWVTEGKPLKMEPNSFRGYGKNIATLQSNLQSDMLPASTSLQGVGKDTSMSTGGFPPGTQMAQLAARNAGEVAQFLPNIGQNCMAISSVACIMGDVFEGMDGDNAEMLNAIQWALGMPGAKRPDNAPAYLDPKNTLQSLAAEQDKKTAEPGEDELIGSYNMPGVHVELYRTGDGGTRSITRTADGITETVTDKDNNTVYTSTTTPSGQTTTVNYRDGKPVGKTVTSTQTVQRARGMTDEVTTNTEYDADGDVVSTTYDHAVTTTFQDGTHTRDYYSVDDKGNKSETRHIGVQGDPVTGQDWTELAQKRMEATRRATGGM